MPINDMMAPEWIRLTKLDGHLGALFHPTKQLIRFVGKSGTAEYDLAALVEEAQRKLAQPQEQKA